MRAVRCMKLAYMVRLHRHTPGSVGPVKTIAALLRISSLTAHFCNLFRDFLGMPSPGFNSFLVSMGTTNETWCVVAVDSCKLLDAGFCLVYTNLTKKMQRRADIPGPCGTLVYRWGRQISRCHVCARLKDDVEPDVLPAH